MGGRRPTRRIIRCSGSLSARSFVAAGKLECAVKVEANKLRLRARMGLEDGKSVSLLLRSSAGRWYEIDRMELDTERDILKCRLLGEAAYTYFALVDLAGVRVAD